MLLVCTLAWQVRAGHLQRFISSNQEVCDIQGSYAWKRGRMCLLLRSLTSKHRKFATLIIYMRAVGHGNTRRERLQHACDFNPGVCEIQLFAAEMTHIYVTVTRRAEEAHW
jgi:hypothetical protein